MSNSDMEKNQSNISSEFEVLLRKYFKDENAELFIERLREDSLILSFVNSNSLTSDSSIQLVSSHFTVKLRLLADRVISFANRNLELERYYWFMLDLVKILINGSELNLSYDICVDLLDHTEKDKDYKLISAYTYLNLADYHCRQANWKLATNFIKKAKDIFSSSSEDIGLSKCELLFGLIYLEQGDLEVAQIRFENSLIIAKNINDESLKASVEFNFGIINYTKGNYEESLKYFLESLRKFESLKDYKNIADIYKNIGLYYFETNDLEMALTNFNKAIFIALDHRFLSILSTSYLNISLLHLKKNEFHESTLFANKSMEIAYQINDKSSIAESYKIKGIVSRNLLDYELSEDFLLTSLRLNREYKNELHYAETTVELGLLYKEINKNGESSLYFDEAILYYKKKKMLSEIKIIELHKK